MCFSLKKPYISALNYSDSSAYEYTIETDTPVGIDTEILLSFLGGTALREIDFDAPLSVVMKKGENKVVFDISLRGRPTENTNFFIEMNDQCDDVFLINIEKYDGAYAGPCCDFFDDTYRGWQETENFICPDFFKDTPMQF